MHYQRWKRHGDPTAVKRVASYEGQKCSVVTCERGARSGGMCATHYNRQHRWGDPGYIADRTAPRSDGVAKPCEICGREFLDTTKNLANRYCSNECKPSHVPLVVKHCRSCQIVLQSSWAHYCSDDCKPRCKRNGCTNPVRKRGWCGTHAAQAHLYKMTVEQLAHRDGTDCGICGKSVDMSLRRKDSFNCASVDHIVPQSLGGNHDSANLRLTHLRCNTRRGNRIST